MIGKIDKEGYLSIKREQGWVRQHCPYQQRNIQCGNWCPQFGEVYIIDTNTNIDLQILGLDICQNKNIRFEEIL